MPHPLLVCISGPTASGKTQLAIQLALKFNAEIISADARQFYREMNIGTAKPDAEELNRVKHHFINCKSIKEYYSAGDFEREALQKIKELHSKNPVVLLVGGSGLYSQAVLSGLDETPSDKGIRERLNLEFEKKGLEPLLEELQKCDPEYYQIVDRQNPQRVIRGLEVFRTSGEPFTNFRKQSKSIRPFKVLNFAIEREKEELYQRIELRTEMMLAMGWLEECRFLFPHRNLPLLKTIGYKELFTFLIDGGTWENTKATIKKNTRNYAKRQMTWFKKYGEVDWYEPGKEDEMILKIESSLN